MNHNEYLELLQLHIAGELSVEEGSMLQVHLETCQECRAELHQLEKVQRFFQKRKGVEVTDDLLRRARQELRVALRLESTKESFWSRLLEGLNMMDLPRVQFALGGVVMLAIGLFLGYVFFHSASDKEPSAVQQLEVSQASLQGETRISNMRFLDPDPKGGRIAVTFDAVTPVRMVGNINDPDVQKILAQALLDERNPGVRLRTVSAFASQADMTKPPGEGIQDALIITLKTDGNPGVRKQALQVLQKLPTDEKIQDAFLHVLRNDDNDGLRIEAIKSLEKAIVSMPRVDQEILSALQERAQSDDNNYIRLRARNVLEEIKRR